MMEMIDLYLEQTPPLILSMKESLLAKDWQALDAAVHKMIPSFSIMGIDSTFETMARKIQNHASLQENAENIDDLVSTLEAVCIEACLELKEEYNKIKNTTNG
jgi:HPt (histidine-containing phosphotransfer) domain-containing protein